MDIFLTSWSYLGLVIILTLTGAGLPIPEEVPVIAAGVLSSNGTMDPWLAFGACVLGALLGDTVMYWLGRHFGRSILREQSWWAKIIHPEREAKIERVIKQHGLKVLFSARFLVGIRAPVYIAAGILHLPYRRFILMDLFCATTVVGLFFGVSYWFGAAITKWIKEAEYVATGLVVVVLVVVVIYFWRRHRRKVVERLTQENLLEDETNDTTSAADQTEENLTSLESPSEETTTPLDTDTNWSDSPALHDKEPSDTPPTSSRVSAE
ncbi:MAG: DedA family protein [Planctomycetia bacterium]|jgi:membrane protein DedA with SNARE-associated domain